MRPSRFSEIGRSLLPASVLAVAASLALRRLDDFDTWWHLAAGRWIVENGRVPGTDTLSYTVPDHPWINLQWLYDVLLYGLYSIGGDDLLVLTAAISYTVATWLVLRIARLRLGEVAAALLVLWGVFVIEERFTIRPEMVSFPLLAMTLSLLATAPRDAGKRLWLLVPLMLVWVNSHSLFIIGLFCITCVTLGALVQRHVPLPHGWRDPDCWTAQTTRRLVIAASGCAVVTVFNPFLVEGALFPVKLMSRIDGSSTVFQAIGEFRRPFSNYFPTFSISAYQALFFASVATVIAAAFLCAPRPRRRAAEAERAPVLGFDIGLVAAFAGLAYLSLLARRNIGIFAVGAVPVMALSLGAMLDRATPRSRASLARAGNLAAPVVFLGCLALVGSIVTNNYYRWSDVTHEFGAGTMEVSFPIHASEFAGANNLPARAYNDLTAGGYLTWNSGVDGGVFIDGRLEVYDTEFFSAYLQGMNNPRVWLQQVDRFGVNTVILFHRWGNRHNLIRLLVRDPSWSLVYYDEVGVVYVRTRGNEERIQEAAASFPQWRERTEARLTAPVRAWQRPLERETALESYAALLSTIGAMDEAIVNFRRLLDLGLIPEREARIRFRLGLLLARSGDRNQSYLELRRAADLDPGNKRVAQAIADLGG
ncbi:MAG: hypothetical protein V3R77_08580 [Candidatus Binatia bacterium]